ncbi:MAG: 2-hydroxychromene-2-carboxylate isomerase [Litorimonas sp.]
MSKSVEFIFDFGSPNAYLAWHAIQPVLERTGATFDITPCLLGGIFKLTGNQAPWMSYANVKGKLDYERLEMTRFISLHRLSKFKMNPHFPVNTLLLMRGAIAAKQDGVLDAYVKAGLSAMWEDGENMSDPDVYAKVMTNAGLDGAGLLTATQNPDVKAKLAENTDAAVARGVFGIPTFFVGNEMFFGKDRLDQVEAQLTAEA